MNRLFMLVFVVGFLYPNLTILAQNELKVKVQRDAGRQLLTHENMLQLAGKGLWSTKTIQVKEKASTRAQSLGNSIPIVFHMLYNNKNARLSEEVIFAQAEALNQAFEGTDIEFCLAPASFQAEGPAGIHYKHTFAKSFGLDDAMKYDKRGGADALNCEQAVNIWVVELEEGISGYAQMPGGPCETDGIVIGYRFFGTHEQNDERYNEGKALVHLMGNYLGLISLWGMEPCGDDGVEDTPIHNAPNYGCPKGYHVSLCSEDSQIEDYSNYMDNSDDRCLDHFSPGQIARMLSILQQDPGRSALLRADACEYAIEELQAGPNIQAYPNPADSKLTIRLSSLSGNTGELLIYNGSGKTIRQEKIDIQDGEAIRLLDISSWPAGLYVALFHSEQGRLMKVFVKTGF